MLGFGFAPTFERLYPRSSSKIQLDELINNKREEEEKITLKKVKTVYSRLNELVSSQEELLERTSPKSITSKAVLEEKKVKFSNQEKHILIPTREEYKNKGLDGELFYKKEDYQHFKEGAKKEISNYFRHVSKITGQTISAEQVIREMYQPLKVNPCISMYQSKLSPH